MHKLSVFYYKGVFVVDSREVAAMIERPHNDLMKSIRQYCQYLGRGDFSQSEFFIESSYYNSQNKGQPCYLLTRKGCDLVANKMTGEKGVLFTAAYVSKFEAMEKALYNNPKLVAANESQKLRAEAMQMNAKTRQVKVIKDLACQFRDQISPEAAQSLMAGVSAFLLGTPLLPLPAVEQTYTATQIAREAGVSRCLIGRLANLNGIKTRENGLTVLDTIPPRGKQVPVFRYNANGKAKLMELVGRQR